MIFTICQHRQVCVVNQFQSLYKQVVYAVSTTLQVTGENGGGSSPQLILMDGVHDVRQE